MTFDSIFERPRLFEWPLTMIPTVQSQHYMCSVHWVCLRAVIGLWFPLPDLHTHNTLVSCSCWGKIVWTTSKFVHQGPIKQLLSCCGCYGLQHLYLQDSNVMPWWKASQDLWGSLKILKDLLKILKDEDLSKIFEGSLKDPQRSSVAKITCKDPWGHSEDLVRILERS